MTFSTMTYTRKTGGQLQELCDGKRWWLSLTENRNRYDIALYDIAPAAPAVQPNYYLGHTAGDILNAGRDILGEAMLRSGDPDYSEVKGLLPPLTENTYCFLGAPASWSGVTVDSHTVIYPQLSGRDREPQPIFHPTEIDPVLGAIPPQQCLADGELPLLCSIHRGEQDILELLCFVEPGDTDRDPIVWIRAKRYPTGAPHLCSISYRVAAISREADEETMKKEPIRKEEFLGALADTAAYWVRFREKGATLSLPEKQLEKVARGAMASAAITFTDAHPHYGHKFYGKELHDNFPPNYLWTIETALLLGRTSWARQITEHLLRTALTDEGQLCYRQGTQLRSGASATEYGQLLFLLCRYRSQLLPSPDEEILSKLRGIGNILLAACVPCPEFGGRTLVKMCAEADTNARIYVYLNNNLWAIRGLQALTALTGDEPYRCAAELLSQNIQELLAETMLMGSRFGNLPPFRFGYTAAPFTLSNCLDTFRPLTEEEKTDYYRPSRSRDVDVKEQDLTENTYANYRYYPEILSAMLLDPDITDSIVRMREELGGEILGMIHFREHLDDWPVINYARFLLESGRIEKYLLLLYAHTAHHGLPGLMCYFEQVDIEGKVRANDCIPSLLTTPLMVGWMFAFERIADSTAMLLAALPKDWYRKPFTVRGLQLTFGKVDLLSDGKRLTVDFSSPIPANVELVRRDKDSLTAEDLIVGAEFVESIHGNRLILKTGITHAEFIIC